MGVQGGAERGWALHVLYGSQSKGSVFSGRAGMCLPPGVCQSGGMGSYWPRSPPSESPKCLEVGGAVEWGGWAGVQTGQQGLGLPCLPTQPLGHVLSCQVLLQVPVFWRPHSAGVWGAQGRPRPSVFLCLCRLLFDLYLVAAMEREMWIWGCQSPPSSHKLIQKPRPLLRSYHLSPGSV